MSTFIVLWTTHFEASCCKLGYQSLSKFINNYRCKTKSLKLVILSKSLYLFKFKYLITYINIKCNRYLQCIHLSNNHKILFEPKMMIKFFKGFVRKAFDCQITIKKFHVLIFCSSRGTVLCWTRHHFYKIRGSLHVSIGDIRTPSCFPPTLGWVLIYQVSRFSWGPRVIK